MCSTFTDEDLDGLTVGELLEHVQDLVAEQNRLAARLTRAVRTAEHRQAAEHDGLSSMRSWLRSHARLSDLAARRLIENGRALEHLPTVDGAFSAGTVTAEHVAAVAPLTTPQRLAQAGGRGVDLAQIEQTLVGLATAYPHRRVPEAVGYYLNLLDPDGPEPDPTDRRSLTMSRLGGGFALTGTLDGVGGEKLATALESMAAAGRCADDRRTRAQRLGDALVQLCDLALASGELPVLRTVKPHIVVTIADQDLVCPETGPAAARTGLGERISAARARWLACDSTVSRIVLDPDGLPVDVGREKRVVPPHLRRAVVERDRSCVFTGCEAPAWFCDVHHLLEWSNDGPTSLDNSALLCERHHTKVHHGFRVQRDDGAPPERRWRTYRPDGPLIIVAPPMLDDPPRGGRDRQPGLLRGDGARLTVRAP